MDLLDHELHYRKLGDERALGLIEDIKKLTEENNELENEINADIYGIWVMEVSSVEDSISENVSELKTELAVNSNPKAINDIIDKHLGEDAISRLLETI